MNNDANFYLLVNNEKWGPYSLDYVISMREQGKIPPDAFYWTEGFQEWESIQKLPPSLPPLPVNEQVKPEAKTINRTTADIIVGVILLIFVIVIVVALLCSSKNFNHHPKISSSTIAPSTNTEPANTVSPPVIPPIVVETASNVDENLFLLYLLGDMINGQTENLHELRFRANRHYQDIKNKKIDEPIVSLYSDLILEIDFTLQAANALERIEKGEIPKPDAFDSTLEEIQRGWQRGATTADAFSNLGAKDSDAALVGVGVYVASFIYDEYKKAQQLDESKRRAIESIYQTYENKVSEIHVRRQNAVSKLEQKYSWGRGEASRESATEDIYALGRLKERQLRNPFANIEFLNLSSSNEQKTPKQMLADAMQCVGSTSLVPADRIYDRYRCQCLFYAGWIANMAARKYCGNQSSWSKPNNEIAMCAVQIWKECLKYDNEDANGNIREQYAQALMRNGQLKEAEELAEGIVSLRKNDVGFAYNMVCLLSGLKQYADSFKWFEHTIRNLGFNYITYAKNDPDLAGMRKAKEREFEALTKVRFHWEIKYGVFNDDIIVWNDSAFPITNVEFHGNIVSGERKWNPALKAEFIGTGQSCKWENVISVPGSKVDEIKTTGRLGCEQMIGVEWEKIKRK